MPINEVLGMYRLCEAIWTLYALMGESKQPKEVQFTPNNGMTIK